MGAECIVCEEVFDDLAGDDPCPNDDEHPMLDVRIGPCPTSAGTTVDRTGDCDDETHHWGRGDHVDSRA